MEHIAALMLLVGCSADLSQCEELPAPTPIYETYEQCRIELGDAVASVAGQRPRIMANCVYVDPAEEDENAELVWDITSTGQLEAQLVDSSITVASHAKAGDPLYAD